MSHVRPSRLRVVRPEETTRPQSRPGPAVLAVILYAVLFAVALWYLRTRAPRSHVAGSNPAGAAPPSAARVKGPRDRGFLLSGGGLTGAARSRFERRLNAERCDCGCGLTIHDCLARDQSCSRSPELAAAAEDELR